MIWRALSSARSKIALEESKSPAMRRVSAVRMSSFACSISLFNCALAWLRCWKEDKLATVQTMRNKANTPAIRRRWARFLRAGFRKSFHRLFINLLTCCEMLEDFDEREREEVGRFMNC